MQESQTCIIGRTCSPPSRPQFIRHNSCSWLPSRLDTRWRHAISICQRQKPWLCHQWGQKCDLRKSQANHTTATRSSQICTFNKKTVILHALHAHVFALFARALHFVTVPVQSTTWMTQSYYWFLTFTFVMATSSILSWRHFVASEAMPLDVTLPHWERTMDWRWRQCFPIAYKKNKALNDWTCTRFYKKRKLKGFHGYACLTVGTKFGVYFLH